MTLHPQARALLDLVAAGGEITPSDEHLAEIRTGYAMLVTMCAGPAEAVADVRDLEIATADGRVQLRVYRPSEDGEPEGAGLPVVVFFHGGGWTIGSIDDYDAMARRSPTAAARSSCRSGTAWRRSIPFLRRSTIAGPRRPGLPSTRPRSVATAPASR